FEKDTLACSPTAVARRHRAQILWTLTVTCLWAVRGRYGNEGACGRGPNGLTVTDLALPAAHTPMPPSNIGSKKAGPFHIHKPKASSLAPESLLRLDGVAPMILLDSAGIAMDRYFFQYLGVEA